MSDLPEHWTLEPLTADDIAPEGDPDRDCDGAGEEAPETGLRLARQTTSTDAYDRGWGPGWPNCQTGTIVTATRSDGLRLPIRKEIAKLVIWLIDETERRGYDDRPDWTWGYSCRAIRGSSKPSNHSWGLAIDINAPTNPMTSNGQLITDMPSWMPALWAEYGFRWGGSYAGSRKDAMHYEFMGTPADAAAYTAKITQPEDDMYTDADRKRDDQIAKDVKDIKTALDVGSKKGPYPKRLRDSLARIESKLGIG